MTLKSHTLKLSLLSNLSLSTTTHLPSDNVHELHGYEINGRRKQLLVLRGIVIQAIDHVRPRILDDKLGGVNRPYNFIRLLVQVQRGLIGELGEDAPLDFVGLPGCVNEMESEAILDDLQGGVDFFTKDGVSLPRCRLGEVGGPQRGLASHALREREGREGGREGGPGVGLVGGEEQKRDTTEYSIG